MKSKKNRQLILGIGTGRCGTVSLFKILNIQKDSRATHESEPILPWKFSKKKIDLKIGSILKRKEKFISDVGFYYLSYIEYILSKWPSTKIICLKRNKQEVVRSYMDKTKGRNHWMIHDGTKWAEDKKWSICFPKYNIKSKEEAIARYWEDYYKKIKKLCKKYPKNIRIWDMNEGLNKEKGIKEILFFIGLPEKDQRLKIKIKANQTSHSFFKKILLNWMKNS